MPQQMDMFEASENVEENIETAEKSAILEPFVYEPDPVAACVICGAKFVRTNSRANACSAACRRERRLRYAAAYRQEGREARQKIREMFGGRRPTEEEIFQLLKMRKGKS
jgi:hypothetical protein